MGVWADDRAQSIQIGAILLFGILILAFVGYQTTVVPNQNAGVEAAHSQGAQADMLEVRNVILATAATGDSRPASVDLGPSYPARAMFVNPGPPAGTLETVELSGTGNDAIRITNAQALDDEAADYWTGDPADARSYQTRGIQYVPQYNVYQNAPTTVYENSVLYNRFRRAAVSGDASTVDDNVAATKSGQSLVNGRTITLVAVQGDRDISSTESVAVDASVVSGPMKTVAVTDSGSPITIQVPTRLSADTWERLLADQPYVDETTISVSNGVLSFDLQAGETYNLRLGGVALGSSPNPAVATYSVAVSGDGASVAPGDTTEFVVEVRDQYNNPVSGIEVTPQSVSDGSVAPSPATTDEDGRATFTYTAPSDTGPQQVVVGFDGESDPTAPKAVEFEFNVESAGGGPSYDVDWVDPAVSPGAETNPAESCNQIPCDPLGLHVDTTPAQPGTPVGFGTSDSSIVTFDPSVDAADSSGRASGGLVFEDVGSATLYTSSGGSTDTLPMVTFVKDGFEDGTLAPWQPFVDGSYIGGEPDTSTAESNSGSTSALIDGVDNGGIVTGSSYDTSNANLLVVEYWAEPANSVSNDEDLVLEYYSSSGNWVEADRMNANSGEDDFNRRVLITGSIALHSDFKLRFRQVSADTPSDDWYVDDVTFARIGGTGSGTNMPPSASFTYSPNNPNPGQQVSFDASGSSDSDGTVQTYEWDWTNDGTYDDTGESATHSYSTPGTYTVRLRVTDDEGVSTTTTRDVSVGSSPSVATRIDDLSWVNTNNPELLVSYDIQNPGSSFERVEFVFENLDESGASKTLTSEDPRGSIRYTNSYGVNHDYEITIRVIKDDGNGEVVAAQEVRTDETDGRNPSGNDDLSRPSDASIVTSGIKDKSQMNQNNPWYAIEYDISGDTGFSRVDLELIGLEGGGQDSMTFNDRSNNNIDLEAGYGVNQEFKVAILVFDDTGAVVDSRIVIDVADKKDP